MKDNLQRDYKTMAGVILIAVTILTIGCECLSSHHEREEYATGYIRSIDWYHRYFILQYDNRALKTFGPLCDVDVPVWQGMRVEIAFRWTVNSYLESCYALDSVIEKTNSVTLR